jgi:hypothetical protein
MKKISNKTSTDILIVYGIHFDAVERAGAFVERSFTEGDESTRYNLKLREPLASNRR